LAIIILHAIAGVCTPACLRAASISVEAVTPPLLGWPIKELLLFSQAARRSQMPPVSYVRLAAR